jgi:hypothetical protein
MAASKGIAAMFKFLLKYPVVIIFTVVALMSGILSIVREVITLYAPGRFEQRSLFWACVRIALVISAFLAMYGLYQRGEDLRQQLTEAQDRSKPKLSWRFDQWFVTTRGGVPNATYIFIQGVIKNTGAPSIVDAWQFVLITQDGKSYEGEKRLFTGVPFFDPAPGQGVRLYQSDNLILKQPDEPIPSGGRRAGWLLFIINKPQAEVFDDNAKMQISFEDVTGVKTTETQIMRGTSKPQDPLYFPGFQMPPSSPSTPEPKKNE